MLPCPGLLLWSPQPQDAYGLEKLVTEELCMHYDKDFGMECRIARFHNIYGAPRALGLGRGGAAALQRGQRGRVRAGLALAWPGLRCLAVGRLFWGGEERAAAPAAAQGRARNVASSRPTRSPPPASSPASAPRQAPTARGRAAARRRPPPSAARR